MEADHDRYCQGVGGRLATTKSPLYEKAMMRVEGRTNRHTARYMLLGDMAYVIAAADLGLTPTKCARSLCKAILELLPVAEEKAEGAVGDVVLQREIWITELVGRDDAAWVHLGRHRAESLRGFLPRMVMRQLLREARCSLLRLCRTLLDVSVPLNDALAPVFHHLQHAGYTTVGEYLTSFAINLAQHLERLREAEKRLDLAPPTLTGRRISVDLARHVSASLGFTKVAALRQQLHVTEDQFIEPFACLVNLSVGVARLSEDLRLYSTSEFSFFELSDSHASTSSALPQKKNAFVLQLIIGGTKFGLGRLAAQLATSTTVSEEADSVYHAGSLYQHGADIVGWIELLAEIVREGRFDEAEMARKASLGFAGAGEAQDILVFERQMAPRIAHHHLGAAVRAGASAPEPERRSVIKQALEGLGEPDYLADVIVGNIVPETALNRGGLLEAQAELRVLLDEEGRRLDGGNPYEAALERLVARGRVFADGGEDAHEAHRHH